MPVPPSRTDLPTPPFRSAIGLAIRLYRASPLYPRLGGVLARLLSLVQRRGGTTVCRLGGFDMELDLGEVIDAQLFYTGVFEPRTQATIERVVGRGQVAVDVGANVGFFTLGLALRVGPEGRVYAFEPTARAFARLERNLSLNSFTNVEAQRLGLSDQPGALRAGIQSSYRIDGADLVVEQEIQFETLDAWAGRVKLDRLDFLKIDTDGMEARVLGGAQEVLRRFRPVVSLEFVPQAIEAAGGSAEQLLQRFEDLGYRLLKEGTLDPWAGAAELLAETRLGRSANLVAWPSERAVPEAGRP